MDGDIILFQLRPTQITTVQKISNGLKLPNIFHTKISFEKNQSKLQFNRILTFSNRRKKSLNRNLYLHHRCFIKKI